MLPSVSERECLYLVEVVVGVNESLRWEWIVVD